MSTRPKSRQCSSILSRGFAPRDLLDVGTGTGRMLELLGPLVANALGIDQSREMLAVARVNIERAGLSNCMVRLGDMYQLPLPDASFDAAVIHQVLHYADRPAEAIAEAARVLRPGGGLIIVDFAPHALEFLRDEHAHRRLGFADDDIAAWCGAAGLELGQAHRLAGDPLTVVIWTARRQPAPADPIFGNGRFGRRVRAGRAGSSGVEQMNSIAGAVARGLLAADPVSDFDAGPPRVSFEFFPPKTAEMEERLWAAIKRLEPLRPRFVSVTYGAGGSTRERTHATVRRIRDETALEPAAHLTCVAATRDEVDAVARAYWEAGIRHIVALRGDPPNGPMAAPGSATRPTPEAIPTRPIWSPV